MAEFMLVALKCVGVGWILLTFFIVLHSYIRLVNDGKDPWYTLFGAAFVWVINPADAWPVIAKHQISICAYERNNPGMKNEYWWEADRFCEFITIDNNPLRAAMIVFLMMQDANNA